MTVARDQQRLLHQLSIVIPVYRGAATLPRLVDELIQYTSETISPGGARWRIAEVLLVHDCGPDDSDVVIRQLVSEHPVTRAVWLSRNFGQHAATLAGMASSGGDWIVTLDEDGQHDPQHIAAMLDTALAERATVVYADPTNEPPHGWVRNTTSRFAKWVFLHVLSSGSRTGYHSYRFVHGEIGRSLAAYAGPGTYLDVALGWVTTRFAFCPVELRSEGDRTSGYSVRSLASHFWRLVLTSGTRPLRLMSVIGGVFAALGFIVAAVIVVGRASGRISVEGWTSLSLIMLVGFGLVLFTLGLAAEYVGVTARMAMGQPPYLIVSDERDGPLGDAAR